MLRIRLDKVPWEKFFLIANGPLTTRPYPDPDTCSRVWVTLAGALLALVFPLNVRKHDQTGNHPALAGVLYFALAAMGVLVVLAVLMSIRRLRSRTGLSYFSMQFAVGCLRLNMWVMSLYLIVPLLSDELSVDNEQQFIWIAAACYTAVFILGETILNIFVFRRTVSRIEQNKYRSNGPGFWDGERAWRLFFVLIAAVMFSAAIAQGSRVFWRFAGLYMGTNYGVTDLTGFEAYIRTEFWLSALWSLITAMTCVLTVFYNVRAWTVLYCFRRFGSKYIPPENE